MDRGRASWPKVPDKGSSNSLENYPKVGNANNNNISQLFKLSFSIPFPSTPSDMLTIKQLNLNFLSFYICSTLNALPITIEPGSGKIQMQTNVKRLAIWYSMLAVVVLRTFFGAYLLFRCIFVEKAYMEIPGHLGITLGFAVTVLWCKLTFINKPRIFVTIFNSIVAPPRRGKKEMEKDVPWSELTKQEAMVLGFPLATVSSPIFSAILYFHNPMSSYFMYSVLSSDEQSVLLLVGLGIADSLLIGFVAIWGNFVVFIFIMFLQKCTDSLHRGVASLKKWSMVSKPTVWAAYRDCRKIQMLVQLFNESFSKHVFLNKIFCGGYGVIMISFSVRLMAAQPIVGGFLLGTGIQVAMVFIVVFEKAFVIPKGFNKYKRKMVSTSRQLLFPALDGFSRSVKSIPDAGIKVGSFHKFEKMSSAKFFTYVAKFIMKLLMSFKH